MLLGRMGPIRVPVTMAGTGEAAGYRQRGVPHAELMGSRLSEEGQVSKGGLKSKQGRKTWKTAVQGSLLIHPPYHPRDSITTTLYTSVVSLRGNRHFFVSLLRYFILA